MGNKKRPTMRSDAKKLKFYRRRIERSNIKASVFYHFENGNRR